MIYYDPDGRLQLAHEHAEQLAAEMRRSRRLTADEAGYPRWARLAAELLVRVGRLRHGRSQRVPAYDM
jgi:hypothetical protein